MDKLRRKLIMFRPRIPKKYDHSKFFASLCVAIQILTK
ncbi:MAG: hypothetical protein ACI9IL_001106 [Rickettsiales bacterium]|jgi:hypothetical protein